LNNNLSIDLASCNRALFSIWVLWQVPGAGEVLKIIRRVLEDVLFDSIQLDRIVAIRKQTKSFFVAKTA
jgi:hypothetical protein